MKRVSSLICSALLIVIFSVHLFAVIYSDGAPGAGAPYEYDRGSGGVYGAPGGNSGGAGGGRLGENYNSPSANGGGRTGVNDNADSVYNDMEDGTTEEGEVLGVTDTDNSAIVGIAIAILIAVAVIVLIIALIPRSAGA